MLNSFFSSLAVALYGIVGGPGVGKTSIIEALKEKGETTVREVATDYIFERMEEGVKEPWAEDNFQLSILNRTLHRENETLEKSRILKKKRVFSDRAILDLFVYLDVRGKLQTEEFKKGNEIIKSVKPEERYKAVFLVLPWGDATKDYRKDLNRHEELDEAQKLTQKTYEIYSQYFSRLIEVPGRMSPKERAEFVLRKVEEIETGALSLAALK